MASSFFAKFIMYIMKRIKGVRSADLHFQLKRLLFNKFFYFFFNINNNIFAKITDPLMK